MNQNSGTELSENERFYHFAERMRQEAITLQGTQVARNFQIILGDIYVGLAGVIQSGQPIIVVPDSRIR